MSATNNNNSSWSLGNWLPLLGLPSQDFQALKNALEAAGLTTISSLRALTNEQYVALETALNGRFGIINLFRNFVATELPRERTDTCELQVEITSEYGSIESNLSFRTKEHFFWTWVCWYSDNGTEVVSTGHSLPEQTLDHSHFHEQLTKGRHFSSPGRSLQNEAAKLPIKVRPSETVEVRYDLFLWEYKGDSDTALIKKLFSPSGVSKTDSILRDLEAKRKKGITEDAEKVYSSFKQTVESVSKDVPDTIAAPMSIGLATVDLFRSLISLVKKSFKDKLVGMSRMLFKISRDFNNHLTFKVVEPRNPEERMLKRSPTEVDWVVIFKHHSLLDNSHYMLNGEIHATLTPFISPLQPPN